MTGGAIAAGFAPPTTAEQFDKVTKIAEKVSGISISTVLVWTPGNSAEYERFWSAFAYTHEYFVDAENWLPRLFESGGGGDGEGNE